MASSLALAQHWPDSQIINVDFSAGLFYNALKGPYKALEDPYKALKRPYKAIKRLYKALKEPYKPLKGPCKAPYKALTGPKAIKGLIKGLLKPASLVYTVRALANLIII